MVGCRLAHNTRSVPSFGCLSGGVWEHMSVCSGAQFFVGYCVVFVLRVGRLVHMQHVFSFRRSVVLAECLGTHVGTMVGIMKTVFVVLCERFCGFFCLVCVSLLVWHSACSRSVVL